MSLPSFLDFIDNVIITVSQAISSTNLIQTIGSSVTGMSTNITGFNTFAQGIITQINGIFTKLKLMAFFALFVSLGKCILKGFELVWKSLTWIFTDFIPWFLYDPWPSNVFEKGKKYDKYVEAAFLPWAIRYFIVLATKVANFPKCFIWYIIEIFVWTIYLPFRFLLWLIDYILNIGIVKGEHKVWNFLNDMDYYIHGPVKNYFLDQYVTMYSGDKMYKDGEITNNPNGNVKDEKTGGPKIRFDNFEYTDKNNNSKKIDVDKEIDLNPENTDKSITEDMDSMNFGFHIIHFPNSVMETCYSATGYKLADLKPYPQNEFNNFISCITKLSF
jgi:hypothetical protein